MKGYDLREICSHFRLEGEFQSGEPYGEGHINNTYSIQTDQNRYILQRINHLVFSAPEQVMSNIVLVTDFLREKIIANHGDPLRETLTLILTTDGATFYENGQGDYFRVYLFIDGAKTYQKVEKPEHFYHAARAFGRFQNLLAEFPADKLYETIPRFHDTPKRYRDFLRAVDEDKAGRKKDVAAEIAFAMERQKEAGIIVDAIAAGEIPLRVTHNDTKFNNIMIDDQTGEGICIIDLDTVMPGSLLYDYGDSIRFGANNGDEDETDLRKIYLNETLFETFTKGFLEELKGSITPKEIELLPLSAKMMTLECGVRFLTDYLEGDHYFKIHRPQHNLDRCRTQFKLVESMEQKAARMKEIVAQYAN